MDKHTGFPEPVKIIVDGIERHVEGGEWKQSPAFKGVWMKHLVLGADTDGALSCHLVRVEQGSAIGLHIHEGCMELHEVLDGRGTCTLAGREVAYEPGVCMVIPAGAEHEVRAVSGDLRMMARFAPALL